MMEKKRAPIQLTENQEKVIKDKYLKDAPSIEAWVDLVASNVALAEVLHHRLAPIHEIYNGVNYKIIEKEVFDKKSTKMFLVHASLKTSMERRANFNKFLNNLQLIVRANPAIAADYEKTRDEFYNLMANFEFLPNSPTLMNAGRPLQQLSACYVLPIEDSIEGWMKTVSDTAIIHQSGGGTGFSASRIRPNGDTVRSTSGVASGPLSPLKIIDATTERVKQGGQRRGANMGILSVYHPDIMDFIHCKKEKGFLENFNISVAIDEPFMQKVKKNEEFELVNPRNGEVVKKLNAKDVFDEMVHSAWQTGDPGFVVIDRINNSDSNPTPHVGLIESTNPCVTGDTFVSTEKGLVRMRELVEGYGSGGIKITTDNRVSVQYKNSDGTIQLQQQNQQGVSFDGITRAFSTGIKDVYQITTHAGYELTATADHKVLAREKEKVDWVSVENLDPERHMILIQGGEGKFSTEYNLPFEVKNGKNEGKYKLNLPTTWSKELGQILGWLIGDGWLKEGDKNCRVGFTFGKDDGSVLNYLKPILNQMYGKEIKEVKRKRNTIHLSYHSKWFGEFFKNLGVLAKGAEEKVVPKQIFTAPKEAVTGFLQGLFSSDGTIGINEEHGMYYIRLTSKSEKLLKETQLLLLNLGIKSKIYDRSRKPREKLFTYIAKNGEVRHYKSDGVCYELQVNKSNTHLFLQEVGFIGVKHEVKVELLKGRDYQEDSFEEMIAAIVPKGKEEVFDLTEPRTLSFITNGLLSLDCGEQPLLPYEPCNLGSINLSKFVDVKADDFNWNELKRCVHSCVHFLDSVIDVNNYPLPEIEEMAKGNRRIGLGVMGWAESLSTLRIPYNADKAVAKGEQVMKFIDDEALVASEHLAQERGVFPNWKNSIFDGKGQFFRGQAAKPRHCARTTIAPTGTIAITAGLQGSGIEPFFAIVYVRYNAKGIDMLKKGEKPLEKDTFYEINPIFKKVALANNFFGLKEQELWDKIEQNHKSVLGIKEIPTEIQQIFLTSHDLGPKDHCMMQVAFQRYTNNAVSKTVNLKHDATEKDVCDVYMLAYEQGCKGVTIYRDGSKSEQVLNLSERKTEKAETKAEVQSVKMRKRNSIESSDYYEILTGNGPLHVHINYDEIGPTKIFVNLSPSGTETSGLACALGIMISKYLQTGGDPIGLLKHLNSIKGDKPFGFGAKRVDSIPHGISKALRDHLIKTGKLPSLDGQMKLSTISSATMPVEQLENQPVSSGSFISVAPENPKKAAFLAAIEGTYLTSSLYCPKCFSANVEIVSGCSKPTCFDCGFSECG